MENDRAKFRLRLNLFDGIVLILALCAAAFLAWRYLKPAADARDGGGSQGTVRYTLCLGPLREGAAKRIQPGDPLTDTVRNYSLGTVVSCEVSGATKQMLDGEERKYVIADIPGYEQAYITVEAPCDATDAQITVGGGYVLQVGKDVFMRGAGYMGPAVIVGIEREGRK